MCLDAAFIQGWAINAASRFGIASSEQRLPVSVCRCAALSQPNAPGAHWRGAGLFLFDSFYRPGRSFGTRRICGCAFYCPSLTIHIALVIFLGSPEDDQGLRKGWSGIVGAENADFCITPSGMAFDGAQERPGAQTSRKELRSAIINSRVKARARNLRVRTVMQPQHPPDERLILCLVLGTRETTNRHLRGCTSISLE